VTDAGTLMTTQCQNPLGVGVCGSYIVTMKLWISSGNSDHARSGEVSLTPAPKIPLR
jgi:hypothetical protein